MSVFDQAIYTSDPAILQRSIFTDKGPIARPPLTLRSGSGASIVDATTINMPGGLLSTDVVGRYVRLVGSTLNDGEYLITSIVSATRLKVRASFTVPDPSVIAWTIYNPRDGEIADDPSHVVVRVNGVPTPAEAVIGLLGQIVLPSAPGPADDVKVDYYWVRNPTIEVVRLNSKEFRFNNWNRDQGRPTDASGHKYRYNNVLITSSAYTPSTSIQAGTGATVVNASTIDLAGANVLAGFTGLTLQLLSGTTWTSWRIESVVSSTRVTVSPGVLVGPYTTWKIVDRQSADAAPYGQPTERSLHYRAFERAYTPVFNDPNLLVFNSPNHRIAYPPLQRQIDPTFVSYQPTALPENDPTAPWARVGSGTASTVSNELVVGDTIGSGPTGQIFWTRGIDLTFPHVFAIAWMMTLYATTATEGVFTGIAAGYATDLRVCVVGFLIDGGVKKFGVLKKGHGNDPSTMDAWVATAEIDWDTLHSYRIFRAKDGTVTVFVDGDVLPTLTVHEDDLPYLAELDAPFVAAQQAFWGSISTPAVNLSIWDFVRYQILPLNPYQTAPSSFASYEGTTIPEDAPQPWTPVGFHGTETIQADNFLLLDSTSATDEATESQVGLMGGDFRGYMRIEPLLSAASEFSYDIDFQGRTETHGIAPNAIMAAVDDGSFLIQLSFLTDKPAPKFSYGGRVLPEDAAPVPWHSMGGSPAAMIGRLLRISDANTMDGRVYYVDDMELSTSANRVASSSNQYILESRCQVLSYTVDPSGFAGAFGSVYDSARSLGFMLLDVGGVRSVALHSEGSIVATFPFEWFDGEPHTYRLNVTPGAPGNVALLVDGVLIGTAFYTDFGVPPASVTGLYSFGSATPASMLAESVVDWYYTNVWRVWPSKRRYVGLWRGTDPTSLTGYHLPLKAAGRDAGVAGNVLTDPIANFLSAGIVPGDLLVVDSGDNKGTYEISAVMATQLVVNVATPFPVYPETVSYRVPKETDWSTYHRYRIARFPSGGVSIFLDTEPTPLIEVGYNQMDLPSRYVGLPVVIAGGLPAMVWGALDPTNLSQTSWDYVRYGIIRPPSEMQIAPHHQILNQRNVMGSPEHLRTTIPHAHTDFWSSNTGIPPQTAPDFYTNPGLTAYTKLNEGTPLVPSTQTSEVRGPTPVREFIASFNSPGKLLNSQGFTMNDGATQWRLLVPDDVLYNSLQVITESTGEDGHIAPFNDDCQPDFGTIYYQKRVCLEYDGSVLPENAPDQPTPWVMAADNPIHVNRSAFSGVLTFGTDPTGTRAVYRNATPLPDAPGLMTQITFRMKVVSDASFGLGDSQVRLGFSAIGMTLSLAFVTSPIGDRYVLVVDQNALVVLGGIRFDWLDGAFHTYRITRDPGAAHVSVSVDS